jgi:hypothetical protein
VNDYACNRPIAAFFPMQKRKQARKSGPAPFS